MVEAATGSAPARRRLAGVAELHRSLDYWGWQASGRGPRVVAARRPAPSSRPSPRGADVQRVRLLPDVRGGLGLLLHAGPRAAAGRDGLLPGAVPDLAGHRRRQRRREQQVLRRRAARPPLAARHARPLPQRQRRPLCVSAPQHETQAKRRRDTSGLRLRGSLLPPLLRLTPPRPPPCLGTGHGLSVLSAPTPQLPVLSCVANTPARQPRPTCPPAQALPVS